MFKNLIIRTPFDEIKLLTIQEFINKVEIKELEGLNRTSYNYYKDMSMLSPRYRFDPIFSIKANSKVSMKPSPNNLIEEINAISTQRCEEGFTTNVLVKLDDREYMFTDTSDWRIYYNNSGSELMTFKPQTRIMYSKNNELV